MEQHEWLTQAQHETQRLAKAGIARPPPLDTVAFFVRMQRDILGWKKDTLASFAGVSTSTIERIERGVAVSRGCLERVAVALKQSPGAFTEPRVPFTAEVAAEKLIENSAPFAETVAVPVRPLTGQRQIAELARPGVFLVDAERVINIVADEIEALREWLDLASFILATEGDDGFMSSNRHVPVRRRQLYGNVLACVREIERRSHSVALAGTYEAVTGLAALPRSKVALIAFFPKMSDPGAVKRRTLYAPARAELVWPPDH